MKGISQITLLDQVASNKFDGTFDGS